MSDTETDADNSDTETDDDNMPPYAKHAGYYEFGQVRNQKGRSWRAPHTYASCLTTRGR